SYVPADSNSFVSADEAAKFVGDFKSLAKEAGDSLAKHKAMELDNERLLKAVVSQDVMHIVQKESVVDTSDLQLSLNVRKNALKTVSLKRKLNMLNFGMIDTRNPLSRKLKNKNVELESQVLNYARENAHLKASYKNLFDSMSVSRAQTKTIIDSLQNELQSNIYKNAKLRTQLFKKASDHKDNTQNTSANTKFAKQPIGENFPKVGKTNALSKPVTSNSVSSSQEPKGVDNTKTRRPKPRSNTKHDRVPSASKSSRSKNKAAEIEEHHRNLMLSKNNKHISSACNNSKIDSQDVISKVVCAMYKKCLISVNHDKCLRIYVNGKIPRGCSKHMTGNLKLLIHFVWKFMGTVRFGNDHVAAILGFGDIQWGNILILRSQELKNVSYHKLYDILKQHQNEVNEIRAERLVHTANPLALVAQQQPVYHPQNHPTHYTQNSSTRSQQAATRNIGKAIVNSPPRIYDQEPFMVAEDDEIANQDNSSRINKGTRYDNQRIVNVAGAKETVEQADWRDDTDDEPDDQELEAHYMYMAQL
nr:integrase, catalytic region, zinc finger, CCHC-type, peptidase aspartic, catalytic [Tanacetum cinerariifolium]